MKLTALVFLLVGSAAAFSPQQPAPTVQEGVKKAFASFALVSTVLSNFAVVPADAYYTGSDALDSSSQVLLAARSGGRAGGRARSAPSRAAPPAPTRVIERQTTIIQQPSYGGGVAMMAPSPMYMAPQPSGLGLALGINAVSGIAEGFREARQENEIRTTQQQLTEARIKEAEMEVRSSTRKLYGGTGSLMIIIVSHVSIFVKTFCFPESSANAGISNGPLNKIL